MPIVGRDEELAILLRRWRLAELGEGQALVLVGEPGIGKSRIAEALVEALGGEVHRLVRYQASPLHPNSVLWPVAQQLARTTGLAAPGDDGADHRLAKLGAVLADLPGERRAEAALLLAELMGVAAADGRLLSESTPQQRRAQTLELLVDLLLAAAKDGPVLAIAEDVQWLDPTTLEFLGQLVDRIRTRRVMLLITSRSSDASVLAGYPHVTRVTLSRLARGDVEAIVNFWFAVGA